MNARKSYRFNSFCRNLTDAEAALSSSPSSHDHPTAVGFQPLWVSLAAALLTGPMAVICRVTHVFGCQELAAYTPGAAGLVGNLIHALFVPLAACYAYLFFGEIMTPLNMVGTALHYGPEQKQIPRGVHQMRLLHRHSLFMKSFGDLFF